MADVWGDAGVVGFQPFFKVVNRTLRLIDTAPIGEDAGAVSRRRFYCDLLASQLNEDQLTTILYYVLGPDSPDDARLAHQFGLLDDLGRSTDGHIRQDLRMLSALAALDFPAG